MDCSLCPWNFLDKNTGVGSLYLVQGIFPTQGSNLGILHCRQILYCVRHHGRPSVCVCVCVYVCIINIIYIYLIISLFYSLILLFK